MSDHGHRQRNILHFFHFGYWCLWGSLLFLPITFMVPPLVVLIFNCLPGVSRVIQSTWPLWLSVWFSVASGLNFVTPLKIIPSKNTRCHLKLIGQSVPTQTRGSAMNSTSAISSPIISKWLNHTFFAILFDVKHTVLDPNKRLFLARLHGEVRQIQGRDLRLEKKEKIKLSTCNASE